MGYRHINNLYKDKRILNFKECYALEKIHGTSSNLKFKVEEPKLKFFSGGSSFQNFVSLFDYDELYQKFVELGHNEVTVYGEAYGGKMQGMSDTYGKELKFVAFEVLVGETWLNVSNAHNVCNKLGIDFVDYVLIPTTIEAIEAEMNKPSVQSVKNGITEPKKREGVVLRPVEEFLDNRGNRILCKHKHDDFRETKTKRKLDTSQLKILNKAQEIANEWVNDMRLNHVLQKFPDNVSTEYIPKIIRAMYEDVIREAEGEIIESNDLRKAIYSTTARMFKKLLKDNLKNGL